LQEQNEENERESALLEASLGHLHMSNSGKNSEELLTIFLQTA